MDTTRSRLYWTLALSVAFAACCWPYSVAAEEAGEGSTLDRLEEHLKTPKIQVGLLVQVVADYQEDRTSGADGFSLGNARVNLKGDLDEKFSYFVQGNFANSPTLLDARLTYAAASEKTAIDAGLFKAPFSAEFLTGAAAIDFVDRARVVRALAPGRQLGAQVRGAVGGVAYTAGVFNGNDYRKNRNDDSDLLTAGRLSYQWRLQPSEGGSRNSAFVVGANFAHSNDRMVDLGGDLPKGFQGKRTLAGVDARLERGRFLVAAEGIGARLLSDDSEEKLEPRGFHATVGWYIADDAQILLRWDRFSRDRSEQDSDLAILGYNFWPSSATELQVNLLAELNGAREGLQVVINFQVSF